VVNCITDGISIPGTIEISTICVTDERVNTLAARAHPPEIADDLQVICTDNFHR
jgi:hypothetical protein